MSLHATKSSAQTTFADPPNKPLPPAIVPPATLGMIGGGQLGRMFALAARQLAYRVIVLEPQAHSPAAQVADQHIQAAYNDPKALQQLANQCAVITTEFENIPAEVLENLAAQCPVYPSADALRITQDRMQEKAFIKRCGLLPVPYVDIHQSSDLEQANKTLQFPAILKTARFGYDGKGQVTVHSIAEAQTAFAETMQHVPCVLEQRVALAKEVSVIVARSVSGDCRCFPVSENHHKNGILHQSIVPARINDAITDAVQAAAERLASYLDFVGVMAVEFFLTENGELFVNEIAPRTHNSGHYTQDACVTSQFEQQLRMICHLPFGDNRLLSPVVMTNILGDSWKNQTNQPPNWQQLLSQPQVKLHLYGKQEARAGRKMGHFNLLAVDNSTNLADTITAADQLLQGL
ncbi:MAG TPA: 5-(carboxyamino)imidazole ribonucleotide synthase [Thiothrix sp.]|nr:5-(carboxyamino)imidazole ribonucleotide synthase [Thiothrix sp.]